MDKKDGSIQPEILRDNLSDKDKSQEKISITYDEYDKLVERVTGLKLQRGRWWPTKQEIDQYIRPNFNLCFDFIVWLLEKGTTYTEEDKESRKLLNELIYENVDFVD